MLSLKRGAAGRDPCAGDPQGGTKCVGDHDEKEKAVTDAKATVTADSGREQLARSSLGQLESISFTKGSRGDWIRTSDLLNPVLWVEAATSRRMSQMQAF